MMNNRPMPNRPIEAAYFLAGGIMPYVLDQLFSQPQDNAQTS